LLADERMAMAPSSSMPIREGSRDGAAGCLMCGGPRPSTRARYCTRACQQRSYRLRHQTPTPDLASVRKTLQHRKALVAHTIYECSGCGERFVGERRCDTCNLFARAIGVGGSCPECDSPVLLEDLLGEEWLGHPELSPASRESAWTCRSARAELGKPLRGFTPWPTPERLRRRRLSTLFSIQPP
jgi:hypothetical protein